MGKERKRYSSSFRQDALERLQVCDNMAALAMELGVSRTTLYQWRRKAAGSPSRPNDSRTLKKPDDLHDAATRISMLEGEAASRSLQDGHFTSGKLKKSGPGAGKAKSDPA